MPKSRVRKKADYSPPAERVRAVKLDSARWVAPLMLALFVVGLLWIVLYYVTNSQLPVSAIGAWNILVGFGFIAGGFVVSTQWK